MAPRATAAGRCTHKRHPRKKWDEAPTYLGSLCRACSLTRSAETTKVSARLLPQSRALTKPKLMSHHGFGPGCSLGSVCKGTGWGRTSSSSSACTLVRSKGAVHVSPWRLYSRSCSAEKCSSSGWPLRRQALRRQT